MDQNRVVQGRMVNPQGLAEIIEEAEKGGDGEVMETDGIEDADRECPDCGGDVLEVGYMPSVTEFVTGRKCQECDWYETDRE
ncbi:DUF5795 family protein [Halalkalicoccus ordinarius]|uniref:DUF5795 family protein n=1 Tax=Halalkalicoccus ordinarius TaxID=3116651 RepID=UPI00300EEF9D